MTRIQIFSLLGASLCVSGAISASGPKHHSVRTPEYAHVDSLFIERWSPRAMSGQPITQEELMTLFEAARWAPSSYNEQPWRFIYAQRNTPS